MTTQVASQPVEMRIADVRRWSAEGDKPPQHVIVLEEVGGTRRLLIWVGAFEAESLALLLEKVETPRPPTFTFMANLLEALGGRLQEVRVHRLGDDQVFYAVAVVGGPAGTRSLDARPSDALNLATIAGAPIRVEPAVLEAAQAHAVAMPTPEGWLDTLEGAAQIVADIMAERHGCGPAPPVP